MEDKKSVAFVLIDCEIESVHNIIDELKNLDTIKNYEKLEGHWKIIVKLEAESLDKIRDTIRWKIRKIPHINTTLTLVEYM